MNKIEKNDADFTEYEHRKMRCLHLRALVNKAKSNMITQMQNSKGKKDSGTSKADLLEVARNLRSTFSLILLPKRVDACFVCSWVFWSLLRNCFKMA